MPDARRVELLDARLVPRLLGGGDGQQDVAVHPPRLLGRHERRGIEAAHLAGDPHRELARVEASMNPMPLRPATAASQVDGASRPIGVTAPKPGDGDAAHEAKSVDHPVALPRHGRTHPRAPAPSSTRSSRFRRWRPSSSASCRSVTAGPTSRSGTDSAACSRTPAASCGCGRATDGRSCATSRSCSRSASCCHPAPRSTARS